MAKYNDFENEHRMVGAGGSAVDTIVSAGLDCKNMEDAIVILHAGLATATGTLDVEIEESDDDGASDAYASLTGAAFTQKVIADDDATYYAKIRLNVAGVKRYLRISGVVGTDTFDWGCVLIAKGGGHKPETVNAVPTAEFDI